MESLLLIIRLLLFAVFALAAIAKLLDLEGAAKAIKDFGAPSELARPLSIALPFAEFVFAVCFLFPSTSWVGALGALILLLSFTGGMLVQMAKGNAPDCHCFGQLHSEPVSWKAVTRNIILSLLAGFLILRGRDGQGASITNDTDSMQIILTFVILVLVAAVLLYLRKLVQKQDEVLKRIELLEVISREGVPLERSGAGSPHDGLPIGAPFPDFDLPTVGGSRATLDGILANGRPAIFFFVSPTCEPCRALLPEIESWDAELGDRVNFILFTSGSLEANAGKFAVFSDEAIVQREREIAEAVYARWTPTAVFVSSGGKVASHLAVGDVAIRDLVQQIREADLDQANIYFTGVTNNGRPPKIGADVPDFQLADIAGENVTAEILKGPRTLAVFWNLTCPHCKAMMDDLKLWDRSRVGGDPQLVVFSDGPAEEHLELGLNAPVVLDPGYKVSEDLGMFGTPSAVIIDRGTIVTETAMGASNIWALVGNRK